MVFQNNLLMAAASASGDAAFTVDYSVRMNSADSANFSRTNQTPTDQKKWTYSTWVKRGNTDTRQTWGLSASSSGTSYLQFYGYPSTGTGDDDRLYINIESDGTSGGTGLLRTTGYYSDVSAWYNFVIIYDSDNSLEEERMKIFVNGQEISVFGTETYPASGSTGVTNKGGITQYIGRQSGSSNYFDGYLAQCVFCDGQAYGPENFGEWNEAGVWRPKNPSTLTFGDNGFYLDFADSSDLGNDVSGNNNDFTANNLASADQVPDTPTDNYAVWNSRIFNANAVTFSEGNTKIVSVNSGYPGVWTIIPSTFLIPPTGKWCWKVTNVIANAYQAPGFMGNSLEGHWGDGNSTSVTAQDFVQYYIAAGELTKYVNNSTSTESVTAGSTGTTGIELYVDNDNGTVKVYLGGTQLGSTVTGLNTMQYAFIQVYDANNRGVETDFGQYGFTRTDDTYNYLSTANLPEPTIKNSTNYFQTILYQGTGAVRTVKSPVGASYFNKYGSGDRSNIIEASGNGGGYNPAAGDNLINGNLTDGPGIISYADNMNFKFQFDEAVHITEATIYWQAASGNLGTWKWQGSNNDSDYTDLSSNEDLTSISATKNVITLDSIGATATYTYYRLIRVSGGVNSTQWEEFNFKVKPVDTERSSDIGSFQPDLVWIKNRDQADAHKLFNSASGATKYVEPNDTSAQATDANSLTSFDSDGFSLGTGASGFNDIGEYFTSWSWLAGAGSGSSNTDGSTNTTTTTVNTDSGVSISTFPSNSGTVHTIGHGLGKKPKFIMVARTGAAGFWCYHEGTTISDPEDYGNGLSYASNRTDATTLWNDTAPTTSVFTVGTSSDINSGTEECIGIAFAEIDGFSRFERYVGNGSADGEYVLCGFRPSFLIIHKVSGSGNNWVMYDGQRSRVNPVEDQLLANTAAAETTGSEEIAIYSNGFKCLTSDDDINASDGEYIFCAWAANPFGGESTTPATAY